MKRIVGVLFAASLIACGSTQSGEPEGLVPTEDTSGSGEAGDDGSTGDDTGGPTFDIGGDDTSSGEDSSLGDGAVDTGTGDGLVFDAPEDTTCATTEIKADKPPVDIIIAIDQSGSMYDDIARVKSNINKLSDYLKATGLDYRVVMIARVGDCTGTCTNMCTPPPLGGPVTDCNATTKPERNSNPPIYRTSNQYIGSTDALVRILSTYDSTVVGIKWADVIRPEAFKAFIPITDDDARSGPMPTPIHVTFDKELLKRGSGTFGTETARKYAFFPICGQHPTSPPPAKCGTTMVNNGQIYVDLAKLTGGKTFPLCATDFGPLFTDIAKSIAGKVACEVIIPPPPPGEVFDPGKVQVVYNPSSGGTVPIARDESKPCEGGANGWQYSADGKKILLCGTACTGLKADPGGKVSVVFGCAGKAPPPPPDAGSCTPFGAKCGDADVCCPPLVCLPGPDGVNICRAKGPS